MKKCVIYSRVSTVDQDFETQIIDLKKYADYNSFNVVATFGEKVSGYDLTKERLEYDKMKQYVLDNNIKEILIWELSRLSRSTSKTLDEVKFFKNNDVNIYFKKENLNSNTEEASSKLLLTMLAAMAEMERDNFVSRSLRGRRIAAINGSRVGFVTLPYGFSSDEEGFLIINVEESKVIKLIYELGIEGVQLRTIAENLNRLNIPTRRTIEGKKRKIKVGEKTKEVEIRWRHNTITKILQSTIYKGIRTYSEQTFKIPQIIDEELWNKVQKRFENKVGYINRTKYEYLLKGKIKCGSCGLSYQSRTDTHKRGISSYYYCGGRKDKGIKCKNGQVSSKAIDKSVYDLMLRHGEILVTIHNENIKNFSMDEKNQQITFSKNQINEQSSKRNRIIFLYKNGFISEDEFLNDENQISNEVKKIEKEIQKIEKEIQNFNANEIKDLNSFKSIALETNFEIKRDFINKNVDKVVVYKVSKSDINFSKITYWKLGVDSDKPEKIELKQPHKNEQLKYYELFAFGNKKPLKAVISAIGMISYSSENLILKNNTLTLYK